MFVPYTIANYIILLASISLSLSLSLSLRCREPDYITPDWVHSPKEGAGPRFGEKPSKTKENLGFGPHICPLF